MHEIISFFSFSDPNIRWVSLACIFLGIAASLNGVFIFLRKQSLVGDAIAHAVLPGICLAFIFSGTKNPFVLSIGALLTGWLSLKVISWISQYSKIKSDAAIAIVLSIFFAIGIALLTQIQQSGVGNQSGLDTFLFGKAAAMDRTDVLLFSGMSIAIILIILFLKKDLGLFAFDEQYAISIGRPTRLINNVLQTLTILSIVTGIQAVGVVLMAALLITPAAAARFWTNRLGIMLLIAACIGGFSGISGAFVSYLSPQMPTGPWIVMMLSIIALASFIFSPGRGVVFNYWQQRRHRFRILKENILKYIYKYCEKNSFTNYKIPISTLTGSQLASKGKLKQAIQTLRIQGYISKSGDYMQLEQVGLNKAQRIVRLHRLWELYLTEYLRIAPDHVHDDAESMEHIITPEIERKLEEKLDFPTTDPHQKNIPYE